jgi:DNA invertase Pin-like site-specific DNA recombinase
MTTQAAPRADWGWLPIESRVTIMGSIAEFERSLICKRCEEGIERAKRKGTGRLRSTPANAGALPSGTRRRDDGRAGAGVRMRRGDDLAGPAVASR